MTSWSGGAIAAAVLAVGSCIAGSAAGAVELVPTVAKIVKERNIDPAVFGVLERELAVPQSWIDGAKREKVLRVRMNFAEQNFAKYVKAFSERYPFIEVDYKRGVGADRALKPLLTFKAGNPVTDVLVAFNALLTEYKAADALARIDDLPAWSSVPDNLKSPDGTFGGWQTNYWCMAYNTKAVKPAELPKTWDQWVDDPRWRGGKVGVGNRPNNWLTTLHGHFGDEWYGKFVDRFFNVLRPQLRKEAVDGVVQLAAIGEYDIALPTIDYRAKLQANRGMPIGFHCPDPVPLTFNEIGYFRGSKAENASKIFINWVFSTESQVAMNAADGSIGTNKHMGEFGLPYPEAIRGKTVAARTVRVMNEVMPKTFALWDKLWVHYGGPEGERE